MAKAFPNTGVTVIDSSADLPAASAALEGVLMFQKDTNELKICDGASWVSVIDTDQPPSLTKIASGTFSSTANINITGVFSSTYTNYRMIINNVSFSGTNDLYFHMLSGTTAAVSNYYWGLRGMSSSATSEDNTGINQYQGYLGISQAGGEGVFDIMRPNIAAPTKIFCNATSTYGGAYRWRGGVSAHDVSVAYDGLQLVTLASNTMSGSYKIYGYRD